MEKHKKYIISFPHIGNYYIPVYNLLNNIIDKSNTEILIPKKNSVESLELGSISSPDFVCTPFKYNMGNYIESLRLGANVLIQIGGGCRYGYYSEVQEQILRDLGYDFLYITLSDAKGVNLFKIYKKIKSINRSLSFAYFVARFLLTVDMIKFLDEVETFIRDNLVYEVNKGEFKTIHSEFLRDLKYIKTKSEFKKLKEKYYIKLREVRLNKNKKVLKVGLVGELYSLMEPFASFFMEQELTNMNVQIKRYTTVTYLLFEKGKCTKDVLNTAKKYISFTLGADGAESIAHTIELAEEGYDGIIHLKPFGCTPEINAMPILQKVSKDYDIPIMYMTFDSQTSKEGILTRLEAFCDMLKEKREKEEEEKCKNII